MATKPTEIIQWANDDIEEIKTINGSLETLPNKTEPVQEFANSGLLYKEPLPRQYLNFFLNLTARYINYLEERVTEVENTVVQSSINGAAAKASLANEDRFPILDSSASNELKTVTWQVIVEDLPQANDTTKGIVERATQQEGLDGIDTDRFVTPAVLKVVLDNLVDNLLESGTTTVFYQSAAPTGWTKSTAVNDRALHVTSGIDGGTTGGSWTINGLSVAGHTLTLAETPSHSHDSGAILAGNFGTGVGTTFGFATTSRAGYVWEHRQFRNDGVTVNTSSVGSNQSHSHGISHNGSWRPLHAKVILCVRN